VSKDEDVDMSEADQYEEKMAALEAEIISLKRLLVKSARGTLSVAKTAMLDTYFKSDRRCRFAREMLKKYEVKT
jgi:hypothetical protein